MYGRSAWPMWINCGHAAVVQMDQQRHGGQAPEQGAEHVGLGVPRCRGACLMNNETKAMTAAGVLNFRPGVACLQRLDIRDPVQVEVLADQPCVVLRPVASDIGRGKISQPTRAAHINRHNPQGQSRGRHS